MPDFLAGQKLTALHFTPTVSDTQADSYTATNTAFGVTSTGGTYNDCGTAFLAPFTGRVNIWYSADVDNTGANSSTVAPVIREGAVVGSGSVTFAATLDTALIGVGTDEVRAGCHILFEGLVPGDTYNVRLEHRVSAGTGTFQRRAVVVGPAT